MRGRSVLHFVATWPWHRAGGRRREEVPDGLNFADGDIDFMAIRVHQRTISGNSGRQGGIHSNLVASAVAPRSQQEQLSYQLGFKGGEGTPGRHHIDCGMQAAA